MVYAVSAVDGDRVVIQRTSAVPETVEARVRGGRLTLVSISTASGSEHPGTHVLSFDPTLPDVTTEDFGSDVAGTFTVAVDDHPDLVTGTVEPTAAGFVLRPEQPAWATVRTVRTTIGRAGDRYTIATAIGP